MGGTLLDSKIKMKEGYSIEIQSNEISNNLHYYCFHQVENGQLACPRVFMGPGWWMIDTFGQNGAGNLYQFVDGSKTECRMKFNYQNVSSDDIEIPYGGSMTIQLPSYQITPTEGFTMSYCGTYVVHDEPSTFNLSWGWKIYDNNDNLIADIVPAQHNDGRYGGYCKVRDLFLPFGVVDTIDGLTLTDNASTYSLRNSNIVQDDYQKQVQEIIEQMEKEKEQ